MPLTTKQEQTAALVADDKLTDEHIARKAGITRRTLYDWKKDAEFITRVSELRTSFRESVLKLGIADKVNRVLLLDGTAKRLEEIRISRAARAADALIHIEKNKKLRAELVARRDALMELSDEEREPFNDELAETHRTISAIDKTEVPPDEALTGLVVRQKKALGRFETVTEWVVDTATLKELRETLKNAAIEMGEWDEAPKATAGEGRTRVLSQSAIVQVVVREPLEASEASNADTVA